MGGILHGILSPALTVATQAAGTYQNAEAQAKQQQVKDAIQRIQFDRQAEQDRLKAAIAQRQSQSAALTDKLTGIKIQQGQRELEHPKPVGPVRGTPEYLKAIEQEEGVKSKFRTQAEPNYQVLQTDQGILQVNPKTGQTRPVSGPNGQQLQKPIAPSQKKAIATNIGTSRRIESALAELAKHPDAVGWMRGRVDAIDQRIDRGGVDARALIANIGSQIVHDRSGAAVTISEYPRLAPFIPAMTDDAQTVTKKLKQLAQAIALETELLGGSVPGGAPQADPVTPPRGPDVSGGVNDADLWEQKRQEGMTAEQATAFVKARHR